MQLKGKLYIFYNHLKIDDKINSFASLYSFKKYPKKILICLITTFSKLLLFSIIIIIFSIITFSIIIFSIIIFSIIIFSIIIVIIILLLSLYINRIRMFVCLSNQT